MKKIVLLAFLAFICIIPSSFATALTKNYVISDAKSNRSFIPISFLKSAGNQVKWNAADKRVDIIRDEVHLTLFLGKTIAHVGEKQVTLSDAPYSENGVTYIPLRFASENLGIKVEWNKENSSVTLSQGEYSALLPVITRGANQTNSKPIVSEKKSFKVGKKSFSVQMVTISLMDPKIQLDVVLAGNKIGKVEDLSSMAKRNKAAVAINGTFFDAYTELDYKVPYGYIVSGGEIKHSSSGDLRTIFTYDKNLLAELIPGADFKERFAQGTVEGGLQAGPRLLVNGKVALDVKNEGFKDPKILTGGGARSALGLTRDHKMILLTTNGATIPQLAEIMKQAGAYQAMNLDGGASSGLYYNGKYLTTPGRKISNAIVIKYQ